MIGVRAGQVAAAVMQPVLASLAMAAIVFLASSALAGPPLLRLALLGALGIAAYVAWLALFARPLVREIVAALRR